MQPFATEAHICEVPRENICSKARRRQRTILILDQRSLQRSLLGKVEEKLLKTWWWYILHWAGDTYYQLFMGDQVIIFWLHLEHNKWDTPCTLSDWAQQVRYDLYPSRLSTTNEIWLVHYRLSPTNEIWLVHSKTDTTNEIWLIHFQIDTTNSKSYFVHVQMCHNRQDLFHGVHFEDFHILKTKKSNVKWCERNTH